MSQDELRDLERAASVPVPVSPTGFNPSAVLPYGVTTDHVRRAMEKFVEFLGFINAQMSSHEIERLECMLMPANFSSIVGEFMSSSIPRECPTIVKNQYHNGHPDMLPAGAYPGDAAQHVGEGIEVKGSRYLKGWQGHNAEDTWLMVFVFDSNRPVDQGKGVKPRPFRFVKVVGAKVSKVDWQFAGRSEESRRTITATIKKSGYDKMQGNWIYQDPGADTLTLPTDSEAEHTEDADLA